MRVSIPHLIVGLITVIAGLHLLAFRFYLYDFWPYFDLLVHFLGGVWILLLYYWIFHLEFPGSFFSRSWKSLVVGGMLTVLAVAVLWEVFELLAGAVTVGSGYLSDTIGDILAGLAGGVAGLAMVYYHYRSGDN